MAGLLLRAGIQRRGGSVTGCFFPKSGRNPQHDRRRQNDKQEKKR
jgi:hypothetical protein